MTVSIGGAESSKKSTKSTWDMEAHSNATNHSTDEKQQFRTVDEAVEADRKYFDEHPNEEEYIREFVPGEFGKAELVSEPVQSPPERHW